MCFVFDGFEWFLKILRYTDNDTACPPSFPRLQFNGITNLWEYMRIYGNLWQFLLISMSRFIRNSRFSPVFSFERVTADSATRPRTRQYCRSLSIQMHSSLWYATTRWHVQKDVVFLDRWDGVRGNIDKLKTIIYKFFFLLFY